MCKKVKKCEKFNKYFTLYYFLREETIGFFFIELPQKLTLKVAIRKCSSK